MFVSLEMQAAYYIIRPIYIVSGTTDNPPPQVTHGELTFHLFLLINSADRLHEVMNSSQVQEKTGGGGGGVKRDKFSTFPLANTLSRRPETRQLEQKMRAQAMTRIFTIFSSCCPPFCQICNLAERGSADAKFHINPP